ncbi:MAG: glutamine amidotransferase, partial [Planctomycetota bacterium]|nr:glutamine amidotransferase [Planctomycetota bacterium]
MTEFSLQFRGVENVALLAMLGGSISAAVLGYGIWRLVRRRTSASPVEPRRAGIASILAGASAGALVTAAALRLRLDSPAGRILWLTLLGAVIILAIGVFYSAVYAYLGRRRMAALLLLRFGAIMALLLILFKPAVSVQPAADKFKPLLPILVDRSASMSAADQANLPQRYRQAVEALASQEKRLADNFSALWFHFAADCRQVEDIEELSGLSPTGEEANATDIAAALRRAAANYSASELAGIVLISDGLHNAPDDVQTAAAEAPVPVHVFGVGSRDENAAGRQNVHLLDVKAPIEAVRNNVTTIDATLRLTGWANIPSRIILTENGKQVADRQVLADSSDETRTVHLKWTPGEPDSGKTGSLDNARDRPDIRKLRVVVEPNPAEAVADDNAAELHVLVTSPQIRVLYVEGTMRPEYKYIRRTLAADPNVKSICMARLAQNRFLSQGSIDGKRLTGLPKTDEDFALFDVIIIGDLDRTFMSDDQMERIRRFVNDGKSLLMLGGRNSFGPGGYGGTPIETALPVLCGSRSQPQETTKFVPKLTAAGSASPIFADIGEYFPSPVGPAGKSIPELLGCVTVSGAKPAANVLAIHPTRRNANGPLIVLAVQQYGAGRSAALAADTTWQWYLRLRPMGADSPYHRFWGQLIRYLAGVDKTRRSEAASVLARIDKAYLRQGEELKITAQ